MSFFLWSMLFFYLGLAQISTRQRRDDDEGSNPIYVNISRKWQWLFFTYKDSYAKKGKTLLETFVLQLWSFLCGVIEMVLGGISICCKDNMEFRRYAYVMFLIGLGVYIFIMLIFEIRYKKYMHRSYEYDFLTFGYFKRKCKIVSECKDGVCEIIIGRLGKKHYKAIVDFPVEVGQRFYAKHVKHRIDEKKPFWVVTKY